MPLPNSPSLTPSLVRKKGLLMVAAVALLSATLFLFSRCGSSTSPKAIREWTKGRVSASVVETTDGDTVKCQLPDGVWPVRLQGIDAPEKGQKFGLQSKATLKELVTNKEVVLDVTGADRYGRGTATIYLGEQDICLEMLRQGMAWNYLQYSKDPAYAAVAAAAQSQKVGLWQDQEAEAPWDWRKHRREKSQPTTRWSILGWGVLFIFLLGAGLLLWFRRKSSPRN